MTGRQITARAMIWVFKAKMYQQYIKTFSLYLTANKMRFPLENKSGNVV